MIPLSPSLLGLACRTFLGLAYGDAPLPENRRCFAQINAEQPLAPLLVPPICQTLQGTDRDADELRGYAFRLGCNWFPHVKLHVQWCEPAGEWLFAVDTHDAIRLPNGDPDITRMRQLQDRNRRLKEEIEHAWETQGLLTFNALLRRGLHPKVQNRE